mmetsp:Transcript_49396/g.123890  ORF Transcript_49396/g.123890 Transcript_49396/m.123890 type:complete len:215 (-) Transcript_49396:12-656(-)
MAHSRRLCRPSCGNSSLARPEAYLSILHLPTRPFLYSSLSALLWCFCERHIGWWPPGVGSAYTLGVVVWLCGPFPVTSVCSGVTMGAADEWTLAHTRVRVVEPIHRHSPCHISVGKPGVSCACSFCHSSSPCLSVCLSVVCVYIYRAVGMIGAAMSTLCECGCAAGSIHVGLSYQMGLTHVKGLPAIGWLCWTEFPGRGGDVCPPPSAGQWMVR